MKYTYKKLLAGFLAAVFSLSLLTGCTSEKNSDTVGNAGDDPKDSQETSVPDFPELPNTGNQGTTGTNVKSVGQFTTQDVNKKTVTSDIFKEHQLTMVNVFATWCSPCVAEMPDLERLYQQMKARNVGVVGVVLDVLNEKGEIVDEDLARAQLLVQKTGVTYPILLPDSGYFNGRLIGIEALPETFFVDQNGNIVGGSYSGSGGLEDWLEVVEQELANLKEGA